MTKKMIIPILILAVFCLCSCINIYNPAATSTPTSTPTSSPTTTPPTTSAPPTSAPPTLGPPTFSPPLSLIPQVQFEDRTWVLEQYGKPGNLQDAMPSKEVTARFDSATGKVSGNAGCNTYNANYNRTWNKVNVSGLMSTMMACPIPAGVMQQESEFKDELVNADGVRIVGIRLEISSSLNRVLILRPK